MNLVYGTIIEVFEEDGVRFGKIRVGAAFTIVPLTLIPDASVGKRVLISDGVAISKVGEETKED